MKILYHTIFSANPWGNGGEKRTAQLAEILEEANITRELPDYSTKAKIKPVLNAVGYLSKQFNLFKPSSIKKNILLFYSMGSQITAIDNLLKRSEDFFIWESTNNFFYFLPYWTKKRNKHIIAIPHNLESLVPNQQLYLTNAKSPIGFKNEIDIFKRCDYVFTISREENYFLRLFGVNSYYLPYYPTREVEKELLLIRERRAKKSLQPTKQILLLGTAVNNPTREGMESRIIFFEQNNIENIELRVGGYGTGIFKDTIKNTSQIILLGELPKEQLDAELINTDALLIHQPPTTGALTRIIEMLIAGIPVIVNDNGARSYWGMNGVHVYDNENELIQLLNNTLSMPALPIKPTYDQFIKSLNTIQ